MTDTPTHTQLELSFDEERAQETLESLADAVSALIQIVSTHATLLAHLVRVLEKNDIEVPPVFSRGSQIH